MMDAKVTAVLDSYHERIRAEHGRPRNVPDVDRDGGQDQRMRAVGPQTGQLLNVLVRCLKAPTVLEIGTSFGYSGIWLAEAARAAGGRVITVEVHGYKSAFAREMAERAGLAAHIDFRVGDAVEMIGELDTGFDFVLLDLWKELYVPCLETFYPKLNPGAVIVADNVGPGQGSTADYVTAIRRKPHISSVMLPVGQGIEISRFRDQAR